MSYTLTFVLMLLGTPLEADMQFSSLENCLTAGRMMAAENGTALPVGCFVDGTKTLTWERGI